MIATQRRRAGGLAKGSETFDDGGRELHVASSNGTLAAQSYLSPLLPLIPNELLETLRYLVARFDVEETLPQRIGVVAAMHGSGVTTVARSMAAVLANDLECNVCLVDLRSSLGSGDRDAEVKPGLFEVLAGDFTVEDALSSTLDPRVHVLGVGGATSQVTREMIRSPRMAEVYVQLEKEFDHIIVEVPPILAGSDSLAVMRHIQSYLLVVRHGVTTIEQVRTAVEQLPSHTPLGVVMNQFSSHIPKSLRRFFTV